MAALRFFFTLLMIPVSLIVAFFSISAALAFNISPDISWIPAFSNLVLPVLLTINFILFIFWIIGKKWWAIVPAISILININYLLYMIQFTLNRENDEAGERFRIVSYNIERFEAWQQGNPVDGIANFILEQQADIVCFQEYRDNKKLTPDSLRTRLKLPYSATTYLRVADYANFGLGIYSKYPIVNYQKIPFHSETNDAMWADLKIGNDTIRVISCHLQTTNFSSKRKALNNTLNDNNIKEQKNILSEIILELQKNFELRAEQANIIRQVMDTTRYPILVCGDFNDTPTSYTYHQVKGNLTDGFRACGNGYGYTYQGIKNLLRIDFILYSKDFQGISYNSPTEIWSDHKPVVMDLIYKQLN